MRNQQSTPDYPKSKFYSSSVLEVAKFKKGVPPKEIRLMNSVFKKRMQFDEDRKE